MYEKNDNSFDNIFKNMILNKDKSLTMCGYFVVIGLSISIISLFIKSFKFIFKKKKRINNNEYEYFLGKGCSYCKTLYFNVNKTNCVNCGAVLEYSYLRKVGVNNEKNK